MFGFRFNFSGLDRMVLEGRGYRYVERGRGGTVVLEDFSTGEIRRTTDDELLDLMKAGQFSMLAPKPVDEDEVRERERQWKLSRLAADPELADLVSWMARFVLAYETPGDRGRSRSRLDVLIGQVNAEVEAEVAERNARRLAGAPLEALRKAPTAPTLHAWILKYERAGFCVSGLIPNYHLRGNRTKKYEGETIDCVHYALDEKYLQLGEPTMVIAYAELTTEIARREAEQPGKTIPLPSKRFLYRYRDRTVDKYTLAATRKGREYAQLNLKPFGSGPIVDSINYWWEIDLTEMTQFIIVYGPDRLLVGHAFLTAVLDCHSRAIMGRDLGWDQGGFFPLRAGHSSRHPAQGSVEPA